MTGRYPMDTIGFGMVSEYSFSRVPSPPQNRTTFIAPLPGASSVEPPHDWLDGPAGQIPFDAVLERSPVDAQRLPDPIDGRIDQRIRMRIADDHRRHDEPSKQGLSQEQGSKSLRRLPLCVPRRVHEIAGTPQYIEVPVQAKRRHRST